MRQNKTRQQKQYLYDKRGRWGIHVSTSHSLSWQRVEVSMYASVRECVK